MNEVKALLTNWQFKAIDEQEWLPAQVPGCVHTDLLRGGKIEAPFVGTNEKALQWIDKKDWEYRASFDASAELLASNRVELVFEGLDTYADVYVNGRLALSADNMFRTWVIDAKPDLREGANELRVAFRSPIQVGLGKLEAHGYGLPASNDDSATGELGDKKLSVFTRKAPYHYGWDWGPRFVTSGIWRDAYLRGWSGVRVRDLFIRQDAVTSVRAKATAVVEIESETDREVTLCVGAEGSEWKSAVGLKAGVQTIELPVEIASPKLWWSRGLGEPHRYTFEATVSAADGSALAEKSVRTGLRSVKLIREPDEKGSSFYFELNGVPVFAKGANHIPNDSFVNETTSERYRHEIASAAESNYNMLRVWGGGIYEMDIFYELCDEYGLLVWQDFMFACSMYPGDQAFLDNVRAEAEDNVRRLRNHPSIALWCGNNEIDAAWQHYNEDGGWGWKKAYSTEQREKIWADYESVFHRVLPEVVEALAPDIAYWPSSPMQMQANDASMHAGNATPHGDIHFWAVWHAQEPFENYKNNVGRFMSEYGFQSFPEYKTVRSFAEEADMALDSEVMLHHQKNGRGNFLIKDYSDRYMKDAKDFASFLYMSSVLQAEGMKMAIEAHRRAMRYCMGTLYWQINDCWPVASWSSMDYYGRWKATQYYAKRSFQEVIVSVDQNDDAVSVHVVSDSREPIDGTLSWKLYDFAGNEIQAGSAPVRVASNAAAVVLELSARELLDGRDPNRTVLVATLSAGGKVLDTKEHYFAYSKFLELSAPDIVVREVEGSGGAAFELSSSSLAKQVWLQADEEGIFTDNFFDLVPGQPRTVSFLKRAGAGSASAFIPASPGKLGVTSTFDYAK
ncbi:glycoside hydrolase family 2 protein [Cohnella sp. GCM10027633]|uniref:beta-mannosidase n=1 Tax=unclassified Cohnella TaxID=2636738 RepID=UPI00363C9DC3